MHYESCLKQYSSIHDKISLSHQNGMKQIGQGKGNNRLILLGVQCGLKY